MCAPATPAYRSPDNSFSRSPDNSFSRRDAFPPISRAEWDAEEARLQFEQEEAMRGPAMSQTQRYAITMKVKNTITTEIKNINARFSARRDPS